MCNWKRVIFFACMFCCVISAVSCQQNQNKGKYEYYYFPKVNMYYDVTNRQYMYSIDSARTWMSLQDTSAQELATLGEKETLYSDETEIWKKNEEHRRQFGGSILNIASAGKDAMHEPTVVKERRAPVKKTMVKEPEKKKTAVGKFLQKVFGKKKDKAEK